MFCKSQDVFWYIANLLKLDLISILGTNKDSMNIVRKECMTKSGSRFFIEYLVIEQNWVVQFWSIYCRREWLLWCRAPEIITWDTDPFDPQPLLVIKLVGWDIVWPKWFRAINDSLQTNMTLKRNTLSILIILFMIYHDQEFANFGHELGPSHVVYPPRN